jgi:MoxR-like ATPase
MANIRLPHRQYRGDGQSHAEPLASAYRLAEPYVAPANLRDAVNMALYLRRPLLLEGEPGTGKTRLAYAVAYELGYPLKEIYIRSTSQARDLLYTYDTVRRLYDIQERAAAAQWRPSNPSEGKAALAIDNEAYIKLGPLGEAIELAEQGTPSVVLIDEIDKADIDFPNDLLLVLDRLQFSIDEVPKRRYDALSGQTREEQRDRLPLVVITSNREKELPAPFLRRCLFYYIPFPNQAELEQIVAAHFQQEITPLFGVSLQKFWSLRETVEVRWRKAPSTSELLDWVRMLEADAAVGGIDAQTLAATPLSKLPRVEALLKTQSDREVLTTLTSQPYE